MKLPYVHAYAELRPSLFAAVSLNSALYSESCAETLTVMSDCNRLIVLSEEQVFHRDTVRTSCVRVRAREERWTAVIEFFLGAS